MQFKAAQHAVYTKTVRRGNQLRRQEDRKDCIMTMTIDIVTLSVMLSMRTWKFISRMVQLVDT